MTSSSPVQASSIVPSSTTDSGGVQSEVIYTTTLPNGARSTVTYLTVVPYGQQATTPGVTATGSPSLQSGAAVPMARMGAFGGFAAGVVGIMAVI